MMKYISNLFFGIYIAISFVMLLLPYYYSYIPYNEIVDWYYYNYEIVDKITYINFIIAYIISIVLFYHNGYEDGKKNNNMG